MIHPTPTSLIEARIQPGLWEGDDLKLRRIDVSDSSGMYVHQAEAGATALEVLRRREPQWFTRDGGLFRLQLVPGQYYRRMARPVKSLEGIGSYPDIASEANFVGECRSSLLALMDMLNRICRTVHPVPANFAAFGHDIRNALILACTEVELHWRRVLTANGVNEPRNTGDYVALQRAMRLNEYAISFTSYPWLDPLIPFATWGSSPHTTRDLPWYDAYNGVKHDRENEFARGTLQRVFEAIAACVVMICAQFGWPHLVARTAGDFFHFSRTPTWLPEEMYWFPVAHGHPLPQGQGWQPVDYPF
jgi:hypothetical protein